MRVSIDDVSFDPPAGFEDLSGYVFKATSPGCELSVEFELPAGRGTPAAEVIVDERGQLQDFFRSNLGVDEEGDRPLAGAPAKFMRYHINDGGMTYSGYTLVANLGEGDWVKLGWQLELPPDQVQAIVDPVISSFAAADPAPTTAPGPGLVRRSAGPWVFDIGDNYSYPRSRVYADEAAQLRVEVEVHELDASPPDLDERILGFEGRGWELGDREDVAVPAGHFVHLEFADDLKDEWFASCSAQPHEVGDPVQIRWVEVVASAPLAASARAKAIMDDLLASVVVGRQP